MMRIPKASENLVGKVCVCHIGRPFIVTGKKIFRGMETWIGLGLDGKGIAQSISPVIISESGQDYYDKIRKIFGGQASYHG